ncbi:PAS-domain containing protein [Litoreibacter sp.]|nr:PAS-domain containing protein [Litoreibacter sp.]
MTLLLTQPTVLLFLCGLATGLFGCAISRRLFSNSNGRAKDSAQHVQTLTFDGSTIVAADANARAVLSAEELEAGPLAKLTERLTSIFPQFPLAFETAKSEGARFDLSDVTTDGPVSVQVSCEGDRADFIIKGLPHLMANRVLIDRSVSEANEQELAILRATVATSPTIVWREDRLGVIDWVNTSYLTLAERSFPEDSSAWPPPRLFDGAAITPPGEASHSRRSPLTLQDGTTRWYDIASFGHGNTTLHYAYDASKTVRAEEALRNFMQTLTQTFAALPIGLAVFDRNRQLQLFNPALTELTTLEPEWLAARPTLYDVINRIREKRMLPERKDFKDWRQKITELDKSAVNGTYLETWVLPTGQTYKVTGRPHPEGAVAFLIEDISAEISLTRKFRRELELSQSMFDCLTDAIAVFDADGNLAVSNTAYSELWETDPELVLDPTGIVEVTRHWQGKTRPTPLWGDAREFVCHAGDRTEWHDTAELSDGRKVACRFVPLAGGATLVGFSLLLDLIEDPKPVRQLESLPS